MEPIDNFLPLSLFLKSKDEKITSNHLSTFNTRPYLTPLFLEKNQDKRVRNIAIISTSC